MQTGASARSGDCVESMESSSSMPSPATASETDTFELALATKPEEVDSAFTWPPSFPAYSTLESELNRAVESCPDFGKWIIKKQYKYHFNSLLDCRMFVDRLKEQYVKQTSFKHMQAYMHLYHAKRALSDFVQSEEYTKSQTEYDEAVKHFEDHVEFLQRFPNQRVARAANTPRMPYAVVQMEELKLRVADAERVVDKLGAV